jgi:hypothetical protein
VYELSFKCPNCRWRIAKRSLFGIPGMIIWFGLPPKCPHCGFPIEQIDLAAPFRRERSHLKHQ